MSSKPNVNELKNACLDGFHTLHLLDCGHYIRTETLASCERNCKDSKIATTSAVQQKFFICQECIVDDIIADNLKVWVAMLWVIRKTQEWKDGDWVKKKAMILQVFEKRGVVWKMQRLKADAVQALSWMGPGKGPGVHTRPVYVSLCVDDLCTILEKITITGVDDSSSSSSSGSGLDNVAVPAVTAANIHETMGRLQVKDGLYKACDNDGDTHMEGW